MIRRLPARTVITALLIVGTFALTHPYVGIRHDGILYLGEGLLHLDPGRMADDLFFAFGSQASFSIVPLIYARAIAVLGVGEGTKWSLVVAQCLFFCATWWVVRSIVPKKLVAWSMLVLFVASPVYGGHHIFAYGESFFTARSFAEPVILLGLGFLVRGRWLLALGCAGGAMFLHPLLAIPGLLLVWCWLVATDRRWLWAVVLAFVPLGLAAAGIPPFADLFRTYDASWMSVVQESNPAVFVFNWTTGDWAVVALDLVVLAWTAGFSRSAAPALKRLALAAAVSGTLGIATSAVVADGFENVLLTGLQLWRAHWLLHWVAVVALPPLAWEIWQRDTPNDRSAALLLVACIFSLTTFGPLVLLPAAIALVSFRKRLPVTRIIVVALALFCIALASLLMIRQVAALTAFFRQLGGTIPVQIARPLSITLVLIVVVTAGMRYLPRRPAIGTAVAAAFMMLGLSAWDQREGWTLFQENYVANHGPLWADHVKPGDRVYWFREIRAPWLLMGHANFYSPNQSSGVLFNRRNALEVEARAKVTAVIEFQETICHAMNALNKKETSCEPELDVVKDLCSSVDHLSFIVLQSVLPVRPLDALRTGFNDDGFEKTFYLYRCKDIASA